MMAGKKKNGTGAQDSSGDGASNVIGGEMGDLDLDDRLIVDDDDEAEVLGDLDLEEDGDIDLGDLDFDGEEFDDVAIDEELDLIDDVDEIVDDDDPIVESLDDIDLDLDGKVVVGDPKESEGSPTGDEDDEDDDDEDDDDDEVEASLDDILRERLVVVVDDDEEEVGDERGDEPTRVLPRQPDEFVCLSCFLVKNKTQLADRDKELCRDCV
jgi:hypothetical protein